MKRGLALTLVDVYFAVLILHPFTGLLHYKNLGLNLNEDEPYHLYLVPGNFKKDVLEVWRRMEGCVLVERWWFVCTPDLAHRAIGLVDRNGLHCRPERPTIS